MRAVRYAIERKRIHEVLVVKQEELEAAKKALEEKVHDVEVMNRVMVDREERILELKEQVKELQRQLGGKAGLEKRT